MQAESHQSETATQATLSLIMLSASYNVSAIAVFYMMLVFAQIW
jgi:hypothetical protein